MSPAAREYDEDVEARDSRAPPPEPDIEAPPLAFEDSDHDGSEMGEHIMQRLRYFENLADHRAAHIQLLSELLTRHGVAAPVMPHFPELKSPVGNHDPN
jgi:hypothetical protein